MSPLRKRRKNDRLTAIPLAPPQDDALLHLPNWNVLNAHVKGDGKANDVVDLVVMAGEAGASTDRSIGLELATNLARVWAEGSATFDQVLELVSNRVRLGYAFAAIEISNPVSFNEGFTHPLIDMAMDIAASQVPEDVESLEPQSVLLHLRYAIRAGHFAGRNGFAVNPVLVSNARR
jgi:hypothetical protein